MNKEDVKKHFEENYVDKAFAGFLSTKVEDDLNSVSIPKGVADEIKRLDGIRKEILPEKMDVYFEPFLIKKQTEIAGAKYLLGRYLGTMKGAQSYAFIFRKFQTADQFNPTKERLSTPERRATVGEIDSEIEKNLVGVRKTEVAYQVLADRISCLLTWCGDITMIMQNRIRQCEQARRTQWQEENTRQKQTGQGQGGV